MSFSQFTLNLSRLTKTMFFSSKCIPVTSSSSLLLLPLFFGLLTPHRRNMSYDPLGGVSDAMLDSLTVQLREAEVRRAEAERAHQVCHVSTAQSISINSNSQSQSYLCVRAVCVCVYYFIVCDAYARFLCIVLVFFRCDVKRYVCINNNICIMHYRVDASTANVRI